jgi:hypothetical protein
MDWRRKRYPPPFLGTMGADPVLAVTTNACPSINDQLAFFWADTSAITIIHAWIGDAICIGLEKSLKAGY